MKLCKLLNYITVLVVVLLCATTNLLAKPWREIVPLVSTRSDVERLLGKPNNYGRYDFEDERVYISYADGKCKNSQRCECLVPKDTVINIYTVVYSGAKLSQGAIDKGKFKKPAKSKLVDYSAYSDDEAGVTYNVNDKTGEIAEITYFASSIECKKLIKTRR